MRSRLVARAGQTAVGPRGVTAPSLIAHPSAGRHLDQLSAAGLLAAAGVSCAEYAALAQPARISLLLRGCAALAGDCAVPYERLQAKDSEALAACGLLPPSTTSRSMDDSFCDKVRACLGASKTRPAGQAEVPSPGAGNALGLALGLGIAGGLLWFLLSGHEEVREPARRSARPLPAPARLGRRASLPSSPKEAPADWRYRVEAIGACHGGGSGRFRTLPEARAYARRVAYACGDDFAYIVSRDRDDNYEVSADGRMTRTG